MEPYPALKKELNLKSRQEEIEVDYLNKLNNEQKEWLNMFNAEYVNAHFTDRKKLHKNIHNTKKLKQSCDKRNNDRKECVYTRSKAGSKLKYLEDIGEHVAINNYEDILINKIDSEDE